MGHSPSSADGIDLGVARLFPLAPDACPALATAIVAMEPWSVMNYPAQRLADFLANPEEGVSRYGVSIGGEQGGVVSVRSPWLKGPYLELLALLPHAQGKGIGARVMAWFEATALDQGARNLWVCASSFNSRALRFYARHGFQPVATLPGLVADGFEEILLRKFPIPNPV